MIFYFGYVNGTTDRAVRCKTNERVHKFPQFANSAKTFAMDSRDKSGISPIKFFFKFYTALNDRIESEFLEILLS